jgi:lipopolysaccharide transport system ATP-binding protein
MEDVGKEGRTVLFVSHNMATVTALCQRGILLVNGQISLDADAELVTSKYLTSGSKKIGEVLLRPASESQRFWFKKISLIDAKNYISFTFDVREPIKICLEYEAIQIIKGLEISFNVFNSLGIVIFTVDRSHSLSSEITVGSYLAEIEIPRLFLSPDSYTIDIAAHIPNVEFVCLHQSIISFEIEETGSHMAKFKGQNIGVVIVDLSWKESTEN